MFVCNCSAGSRTWLLGTVVGKKRPLFLGIELEDGQVLTRRVDNVQSVYMRGILR